MIGRIPISWSLRKQSIVYLSYREAEHVVASYATCEATWIEILLEELKIMKTKKMKLLFDNKSTINLEKHPMCHVRSNHIERRYHFLRDQLNKGKLGFKHCKSELQLAGILTKPLKKTGLMS